MSIAKGIAIITGSAQGIGRSIALRLARDGFDIAVNDLPTKRDQLRELTGEIETIGRKALSVPADVSVESEVKEMVRNVTEKLGGINVMVANAGICPLKEFTSTTLDEWEQIMAINARSVFLCYKHAAVQMIIQGHGGRIIGASSTAGRNGFPLFSAYCASKFAVRGLTQAAALELGRHKITVNAYAPGAIKTPMTNAIIAPGGQFETMDKELVEWAIKRSSCVAVKEEGKPENIASIVSYLASKEAHFVTGQCITVDGGLYPS